MAYHACLQDEPYMERGALAQGGWSDPGTSFAI